MHNCIVCAAVWVYEAKKKKSFNWVTHNAADRETRSFHRLIFPNGLLVVDDEKQNSFLLEWYSINCAMSRGFVSLYVNSDCNRPTKKDEEDEA